MMKLRSALSVLAVLASTACTVPDESPLRIEDAFIPEADCSVPDTGVYRTNVDFALNDSALVGFRLSSDFQNIAVNVNGQEIAGNGRNDFVITSLTKKFTTDLDVDLGEETSRVYSYTPAEAGDGSYIVLNLLPENPDLLNDLATAVAALGARDWGRVETAFTLKGETSSGQNVETREVIFPIDVYNSGFTGCGTGKRVVQNGPCGRPGGQGGAPVECEDDT